MLGVATAVQDHGDEVSRLGTNLRRPALKTLRRPAIYILVGRGHMRPLGGKTAGCLATNVGRLSLAVKVDFYRFLRRPNINFFANQGMGNAVVVLVVLDVVVDMDPGLFPAGEFIRLLRERFEGRLVQVDKQRPPGLPQMLHRPVI